MKENETVQKVESEREAKNKLSRRDFLKYGVAVAAVAAGATALSGKLPSLPEQPKKPTSNNSNEPIVAAVNGDQLTVMKGHASVNVKDAGLAALIADKLREGN